MGLDLTLVPIRNHKQMTWWLAYDRFALDRDGLGHMIGGMGEEEHESLSVKTKRVPKKIKFDWYGDDGCDQTKTDSYGDDLEYALAGDLAEAMKSCISAAQEDGDGRKFSPWNLAVCAFIRALPKETPVVLYWH
jgi:hypothetical protein